MSPAVMDQRSLALVLEAALSPNLEVRKAAEQSISQCQYTPQHSVRLLEIIITSKYDIAVRQAASVLFKNFIKKSWCPCKHGEALKISEIDKDTIRNAILGLLIQHNGVLVPEREKVKQLLVCLTEGMAPRDCLFHIHPCFSCSSSKEISFVIMASFLYVTEHVPRTQLGESLKTIVHFDYPEHWQGILVQIKHNLVLQDQQVLGALYVLKILIKQYQYAEEPSHVNLIVDETFAYVLIIFRKLIQIVNPTIEVADLIKLICKNFFFSTYLEIPKQLLDPDVFNAWMILFLNILERPVPLEGQPTDTEVRRSWGWWKVKKWTIHILNSLHARFGDIKFQRSEHQAASQTFQENYAGKILESYLCLLNSVRVGEYLPDRVTNLILSYLTSSISNSSMYQKLQPQLDIIVFEIIFPLMCFNDNDKKLWEEDPYEYVRNRSDSFEGLYCPKTAAVGFMAQLLLKDRQGNLQKFIQFIAEIFTRYDNASLETKPYCQKDGALLAIGALCDILKRTEPYKSGLEPMLVQHIFPEFTSRVGHLRSKAAWVAGQYADINFSDQNNFYRATYFVISGLRDPDLPVRVDSMIALHLFVKACKDFNYISAILPQLFDEFFKLVKEVDNEDLFCILETIVEKFRDKMAPYAIELCQNLAAAFLMCLDECEASDEDYDVGPFGAIGCLHAISIIIYSIHKVPHLYVQIEPILLPILQKMLTVDGQDVYEEVLDILSCMTTYSPTISLDMWNLWPLMMDSLGDWAVNFFRRIAKLLENYISRSTTHFLTCRHPDYQQSLWNMLSSIMANKNLMDADIVSALHLIEVVLQHCKGQVDKWVEPYLRITVDRLWQTKKSHLSCLLIQVIANALYYNPSLTLGTLKNLGVEVEVFGLWFLMLLQARREYEKKVCCLGLTSLLALPPDLFPYKAFVQIFKVTLELLASYMAQASESRKKTTDYDHGVNCSDFSKTDEEDKGEQVMEVDEGDEANNLRLQKLASQANGIHSDNNSNVDLDDDSYDVSDDDSDYYSDADSSDEELTTPIDKVDPFILFVQTVQGVEAQNPERIQNLMFHLDTRKRALVKLVAQQAEQRRLETEKEKLEKATAQQ